MADTTVDILLKLQADTAGVRKAVSALDGLVNKVKTGFTLDLGAKLSNFVTNIPMRAAAAFVQLGRTAIETADHLKDASDNIGISADAYQVLRDVVKQTGGDLGALDHALNRQQASLDAAIEGAGKSRDAYQKLGLSIYHLKQLSLERQFEAIAVSIAGADDKQAAFAAAADILGDRALPKLRAALQELAVNGYDKLKESAEGANRFMTGETVRRLESFGQTVQNLKDRLVAKAGNDLAGLLRFMGQEDPGAPVQQKATAEELAASRRKEQALRDQTLATFELMNADQALAEVRADSSRTELQKGEEIVRILRAQADAIDRIRQAKFGDLIGAYGKLDPKRLEALKKESKDLGGERDPKDWGGGSAIPITDADLAKLREANELESRANAMRNKARELEGKGPSAYQRISEQAKGVNDPSVNGGFLTSMEGLKAGFMQFQAQAGSVGQQIASTISGTIGGAISGVSNGIYGLITRTMTWGQAFAQVGASILQTLIQFGVQMAITHAMGELFKKKSTASSVASGAEIAAANAPAAAATSVASYGTAAIVGTIAAIAGIAAIIALLVGGFAEGGQIKGPGTGTSDSILIRASNGEFMMREAAVRAIGADRLAYMNQTGRIPAFADGGAISGRGGSLGGGGGAGERSVNVAFFDDRSALRRWAESNEGQTIILNTFEKNRHRFGV